MESFKEFLTEQIKSSNIKWVDGSKRLNVPYDTLIKWKNGTVNPPEYVKDLIKKEVMEWPEHNKGGNVNQS